MPGIPPPHIACCHGLLLTEAPGHVYHCRCSTRYENLLFDAYRDYRRGELTEQDYKDSFSYTDPKFINLPMEIDVPPEDDPYWPKILPSRQESWETWKSGGTGRDTINSDDEELGEMYRDVLNSGLRPVGWTAKREWMKGDPVKEAVPKRRRLGLRKILRKLRRQW